MAVDPPRRLVIFLGVLLSLPFVTNSLRDRPVKPWAPRLTNGVLALRAVVLIIAALGVVSWFYDPLSIEGKLQKAATADAATDPSGLAYPADDWTAYGGTNLGQRYSALKEVNIGNVKGLKVAWEHHTGDLRKADQDSSEYTFEATPIKVGGGLYFCTPHNIIQALEPETGKIRWSFDPMMKRDPFYQHQTCRGVSWNDSTAYAAPADTPADQQTAITTAVAECPRRIIATTVDARLFALNADTGALCKSFGTDGYVDLMDGMLNTNRATYQQTSAPLVTKDLIILGSAIADNYYENNPSGVIRAFDVRTGKIVWKFDAGKPNETAPLAPGQHYESNSVVAWTQFSADEALGLAYIPFGNASPDQVGVSRTPEQEAFVDALVALDLKTGQMRWKFQTSYHDLWDRDNPSQPVLLNLPKDGKDTPAIIIPTKIGNLWVLDRTNGKPILPVSEVAVKTNTDIPGEKLSATQPMSSLNFTPRPCARRICGVLRRSTRWHAARPTTSTAMTAIPGPRRQRQARSYGRAISGCSTGARWRSIRSTNG